MIAHFQDGTGVPASRTDFAAVEGAEVCVLPEPAPMQVGEFVESSVFLSVELEKPVSWRDELATT